MFDKDLIAHSEIALIKYMAKNGYLKKYRVVYYTKKKEQAIRKYGELKNVKFTDSFLGAAFARTTSKYVFSEFVGYTFLCKPARGQICMSLWHGIALKTIGLTKDTYYQRKSFSYMLCYSDFIADIMKKEWFFDDDRVMITQNPRNDLMFDKKDCFSVFGIDKDRKTVLWLPTFRNSHSSNYHDSNRDFPILDAEKILELDNYLCDCGVNLIIKLHPLQIDIDFLHSKDLKNIYVLKTEDFINQSFEFYEFIGQADALLSDYSSVAIDFMLLDRPIGYVIDDINEYDSRRGFHVDDPLKFMPGHHISTLDELKVFLQDVKDGADLYKEERHNVNNVLNKYQDANNCKRVLNTAGICLD